MRLSEVDAESLKAAIAANEAGGMTPFNAILHAASENKLAFRFVRKFYFDEYLDPSSLKRDRHGVPVLLSQVNKDMGAQRVRESNKRFKVGCVSFLLLIVALFVWLRWPILNNGKQEADSGQSTNAGCASVNGRSFCGDKLEEMRLRTDGELSKLRAAHDKCVDIGGRVICDADEIQRLTEELQSARSQLGN